jgi:hypothetical protein
MNLSNNLNDNTPTKATHKAVRRGKGRYTPWPGRGPYPWKQTASPIPGGDRQIREPGYRSGGGEWIQAPSTSHLEAFQFLDGRNSRLIRTSTMRASDWVSLLTVRYKDGSEYQFWTKDHDRLEFIYLMMVDAEHPGEIGWSHLTCEMIPYRQTVHRRKP